MAGSQTFCNAKNAESSYTKFASISNSESHNVNTSFQNLKTLNSIINGDNALTIRVQTALYVTLYVLALRLTYVYGAEGPGIAFVMEQILNAISDK